MKCLSTLAFFIFGCFHFVAAQIEIKGMTVDSVGESLPYVTIQILRNGNGTSSDFSGRFTLQCMPGDTLRFSRIGYRPYEISVEHSERRMVVILFEMPRLLSPVIINGEYKPFGEDTWIDKPKAPSIWQNPLPKPEDKLLPTFGPGVVISGPISRFTKYEKERKKARKVDQWNAETMVYRNLIQSEKTKDYVIGLFKITEEEFFRKVEKFNTAYPDAMELQNEKEILDLLIAFFAMKE